MSEYSGKILIAGLFLAMLLWAVYIQYIASEEAIILIVSYNIDKFFHFIGGVFVAAVVFELQGGIKSVQLFLFVFTASVIWEIAEVVFEPRVDLFFNNRPELWLEDASLDTLFAFLGAWIYLNFYRGGK